ncbi:Bph1 protein [Saccharomycopsis crataegensis]|uniref:Bph1 protein n=1 Tax=Saccharomycopsis crataegensis TaxID=43959 RepID=A0AAV5QNW7_9ASCO|nr:Bph1 protein [Saccharomycopsis crataegensis]
MAAPTESVYKSINALAQNIELNRRTITSLITESEDFKNAPQCTVFYLLAKLLNIEDLADVNDSLSGSLTSEDSLLCRNIFLNDEFVVGWIDTRHTELFEKINQLDLKDDNQALQSHNIVPDVNLSNYLTQLYSQIIDNVFSLDLAHKGSESRTESWIYLLFDVVTQLKIDSFGLESDNDISRLNLKLFVLEAYYQLASLSPINKLLLSQAKITDIIVKELTAMLTNVLELKEIPNDDAKSLYFQSLFNLYLVLGEVGMIDYTFFIESFRKIIKLNDQLTKKKSPSQNYETREIFFLRIFKNLLANLEKLNASSNIAVSNFTKTKNQESVLTPSNFLLFPPQGYIDFNNLKISENGFTVQMWVQFTCKNDQPVATTVPEMSLASLNSNSNPVSDDQNIIFLNLLNCTNDVFWELGINKQENCIALKVLDSSGLSMSRKFTNFNLDFFSTRREEEIPGSDQSDESTMSNITDDQYQRTKFHNIVLIHKFNNDKHDKFKPSQVYLIVDGQFIQSVNIPSNSLPTHNSEVSVRFGNMSSNISRSYISFNNLLLINKIQPHQWIILNYFLGLNYHHNYEDLNLINKFLGYKSLSLFELKSNELKLNYDQTTTEENGYEDNYESMNSSLLSQSLKNDSSGILNRSFGKIQKKLPPRKVAAFNLNFVLVGDDSIVLNFHAKNVVHKSSAIKLVVNPLKDNLVNSVTTFNSDTSNDGKSGSKLESSYVLNTVLNSVNNLELNRKYLGVISSNARIINYRSNSNTTVNFFNSIDGITTLLKLIESINAYSDDSEELIINTEKLVALLRVLFSLISQHHVFAREMEEKGGYHILSIILKNKKKLCGLKVLDTILEFVGYDHDYPAESVIVNSMAYKSLIVDFDIWKDADKETFKFLLFQFTVFSQDSRYHEYNVNKIVKMKIIKRFVQCLKSNVFTEDFLSSVQNTLLVLVKANATTDIFHALSNYIIYALQVNKNFTADPNLVLSENPELQRKCGGCILELIYYIIGNSPSHHIFKKIVKLINIRWILLLMDDANEDIVKLSLKLLTKMFSILGESYYSNFIDNNGFNILKNLLKKWYNNDEIIVIIFAASFGASQLDNLGTDIYGYSKRLARRNDLLSVSMPEFLFLIFDLIENSIETNNDQRQHTYDVESYERFINCIKFSFKHLTCLHVTFKKKAWISKVCLIIYKLELQDVPQMNSILIEFKEMLSKILWSIIFGSENLMIVEACQSDIIAKQVIVGVIYPIVLQEVRESLEKNDVKLRKKTVCKNVCKLLLQCSHSTNKFIWERADLMLLHQTLSMFIEKYGSRYETGSSTLKALKRYLGVLTLERMFLLVYALTEENRAELKELVNTILYSQETYFSNDVFDSKRLHVLVMFLLQAVKEDGIRGDNSNIMNALRIIFMHRQQDFEKLSYSINSAAPETITFFFESLLVSDDATIIERLNHDNYLKSNLEKSLFVCYEKFENTFFNVQSVKDVLRSISKNEEVSSSDVKLFINFRTENVNWKSSIISSELAKYYRHFQDQQDNFQFFITNFNKMKLEVSRILKMNSKQHWSVDNIEGLDRIHNRVIPKDDLSFEDQLLYKIEVPVVKPAKSTDDKNIANASLLYEQMEALSIDKVNEETEDFEDEEDFELIEEDAFFDSAQEDKNRKVLRSLFVGDRINDLWNVSQLLGLEAEEGILILGETHLYLIENYFHCSNDEVVDIDDAPPDSRDPYLKLITGQPKSKNLKKSVKTHNTKSWDLEKLSSVSKRQFLLRDVAIEFFFANGSSFLIICRNVKERDIIHGRLSSRAKNSSTDSDLMLALRSANYTPAKVATGQTSSSFASKLANAISSNLNGFQSITKKWRAGKISNFYYLMLINTIAGRTFNDLTQYPVFPWVIADYTSEELDLNNPETFRDLSKPMGAQSFKRARQFKERYDALKGLNDKSAPPFHYGTHYSSAMIVTSFLIRLEPYVQSYLLLQGGKFDHADRLFYSIEKAWNSAARDNYADVRELIPEFFYLPEFLTNSSNFQLGKLQNGETINNVILPPWANNDPKIFIQKQREALESPYVSAHLHEWIDLIFGFKQQGQQSVDCRNVFHYLSYRGAINLDDIDDEVERRAMTGIIHNFGQTPLQIFAKPHPPREQFACPILEVFRLSDIPRVDKSANLSINHLEMGYKSSGGGLIWKGRINLFSTEDNLKIQGGSSFSSLLVNGRVFESLHSGNINVLVPIGERSFMTGADDGTINIWKFPIRASKFITFNSSPVLSQLKFQEELEFKKTLRGHLSSVLDIKVSRTFNLAVTLDDLGLVYVWDLVRYKFVREVNTNHVQGKVKHINVSNTTGTIGLASDFNVSLYTINGEFITSEVSKEKLTCISFADKRRPISGSFDQVKFEENHEFWKDGQIVLLGSARGVALYCLQIINNRWAVHVIANFKVRNKEGEVIRDNSAITCIEMNLKASSDEKSNTYGTGQIAAGDSSGQIIVWS